jgi:nucleoid DNA-binding protein
MKSFSFRHLVEIVAQRNGMPYEATEVILRDVFVVIREEVLNKTDVKIKGFGTFKMVKFKARLRWNPVKEKMEKHPAKYVPRFRPSLKEFK